MANVTKLEKLLSDNIEANQLKVNTIDYGEGLPIALRNDSSTFTDGNFVKWSSDGNKLVDGGVKADDIQLKTEIHTLNEPIGRVAATPEINCIIIQSEFIKNFYVGLKLNFADLSNILITHNDDYSTALATVTDIQKIDEDLYNVYLDCVDIQDSIPIGAYVYRAVSQATWNKFAQLTSDVYSLQTNKQSATDNKLNTTDKTVVGAINELSQQVASLNPREVIEIEITDENMTEVDLADSSFPNTYFTAKGMVGKRVIDLGTILEQASYLVEIKQPDSVFGDDCYISTILYAGRNHHLSHVEIMPLGSGYTIREYYLYLEEGANRFGTTVNSKLTIWRGKRQTLDNTSSSSDDGLVGVGAKITLTKI